MPSLARALPEKVEMKHQVNSSWVSYGYDGMGRKLYAEYSESLLKSAMPQSSVMDRLQDVYGGSVASSSSSSSGTVSSGQSAASSVTKSTVSSTVVKKLDLTSEIQGKSIDPNATSLVSRHNTSRTDYCGNVVYEDSVCRLLFSEGYVTFNKNTGKAEPHYYLKDHLGNVRVVQNGSGIIEQANHYYAFGGLLGTSFNGDKQKYKYNGKELDRFLGWDMLDYGARWYDSKLQCWSTVDPLAEKYYHISPYVYCKNDPVNRIDPDGRDDIFDSNGNFIRHTEGGSNVVILNENNENVALSQISFLDKKPALEAIARYYLSQVDPNEFNVAVKQCGGGISSDAMLSNEQGTENYEIYVGEGGNVNPMLNDANNFVNSCYHESRHRYDNSTWGSTIGEVNAILQQTQHPSWFDVTKDFAYSQASYAVRKLNASMDYGETNSQTAKHYINQLNTAFTGVANFSIEKGLASFSASLDNIVVVGRRP